LLQVDPDARIVIASQAPGRAADQKRVPFLDPSGERLCRWLGVSHATLVDPKCFAIVPMGFCYPGKGKSGDKPPDARCAPTWREAVLAQLPNVELTILVGQYSQKWHLGRSRGRTLTDTVSDWKTFWPDQLPIPHPSPLNTGWLRRHAWFEEEVIPKLQQRVRDILQRKTD